MRERHTDGLTEADKERQMKRKKEGESEREQKRNLFHKISICT